MKKKKNKVKEYLPLYLMMLPGLLYLLINNYLPMTGIILAFKKLNFDTYNSLTPNWYYKVLR